MIHKDANQSGGYSAPETVLQIGEGNFLRAFADYILERANTQGIYSGKAVLVQPIAAGNCEKINAAKGEYTVLMRGLENGQVVENAARIHSVSRCINPYEDYAAFLACAENPGLQIVISNTTEAGITFTGKDAYVDAPPAAFPAKMAVFLHKRYQFFGGDAEKGLFFLPVELIEDNGKKLKEAIVAYAKLWELEEGFLRWLDAACCFANTLVDRIVTGFPAGEQDEIFASLGYDDPLLVTAEPFLFWAIECPKEWAKHFPVDKLGLDIVFARDITPYRLRKVRILNGAHTLSVLEAYLAGHNIVLDMMRDPKFNDRIQKAMFQEIIPTLPLPMEELEGFANAVLERFANPFIKHRLLDISLNSVSKFKARCLPTLLDYLAAYGRLPPLLCRALAALIVFYRGEWENGKYYGNRADERYEIRDDEENLKSFSAAWRGESPVRDILSCERLWGMDLCAVPGLCACVESHIVNNQLKGI
ncbi:MAG: tagaturonate reductase [Oscillospiraceae bacterium]|jgi:tagaturonate reductase|nr:tagaturonate reductase [Oscillospiraceae bacterium]